MRIPLTCLTTLDLGQPAVRPFVTQILDDIGLNVSGLEGSPRVSIAMLRESRIGYSGDPGSATTAQRCIQVLAPRSRR